MSDPLKEAIARLSKAAFYADVESDMIHVREIRLADLRLLLNEISPIPEAEKMANRWWDSLATTTMEGPNGDRLISRDQLIEALNGVTP